MTPANLLAEAGPQQDVMNILMLVDDDLQDHMIYQRLIKRSVAPVNPFFFDGAQKALEFLKNPQRPPVDLIFLDINMPGMDGFEFLDAAAQDPNVWSDSPVVIMLSTSARPEDQQHARQFAVVKDYMIKPMTLDHLRRAIEIVRQCRGTPH